jgi:hypothetical protein
MSEGLVKCELLFHKTLCSNLLSFTTMSGCCSGQHSCISCRRPGFNSPLEEQIFNFPFSPFHPSWVTKPSSLKLATSGITHRSDAQRGKSLHKSYKMASIKGYLLLQGLSPALELFSCLPPLFSCLPQWKTMRLPGKKLQNVTNDFRPIGAFWAEWDFIKCL